MSLTTNELKKEITQKYPNKVEGLKRILKKKSKTLNNTIRVFENEDEELFIVYTNDKDTEILNIKYIEYDELPLEQACDILDIKPGDLFVFDVKYYEPYDQNTIMVFYKEKMEEKYFEKYEYLFRNAIPDNLCSHIQYFDNIFSPLGILGEDMENTWSINKKDKSIEELIEYMKSFGLEYDNTLIEEE